MKQIFSIFHPARFKMEDGEILFIKPNYVIMENFSGAREDAL